MRRSQDSAPLQGALARWNTVRMGARKASAVAPGEIGNGSAEEEDDLPALELSSPLASRGTIADMTRTQARQLALTFVRSQRGYVAHEVQRTDQTYDLLVVDTAAGQSFVVRTAQELAHLMTHLHNPTLMRDAHNGVLFVRAPFFDEVYNATNECISVAGYTLIARFSPYDSSGSIEVMIEPTPGPACDLDHMLLLADECLESASSSALAAGERARSHVLAEVSRRLRLSQHVAA